MNFTVTTLLFLGVLLAGVFLDSCDAKDKCYSSQNSCLASKCKNCVKNRKPTVNCAYQCKTSLAKKLAKGVIAAIVIAVIVVIGLIVCICACLCCPFCILAKCLADRKNKDHVEGQPAAAVYNANPAPGNNQTSFSYSTPEQGGGAGGQVNYGYPQSGHQQPGGPTAY